jgi:glycine oxidase
VGLSVTVIGGGVIGLSAAWELARGGARVTLLDAAPEAREASWAAGGMLAPHHEADADTPLWRLGVASLERWPDFVHAVRADHESLDFRHEGGLCPVFDRSGEVAIRRKCAFLESAGVSARWLDRRELAQHEPQLVTARGAALLPGAQVNPRLLAKALADACAVAGVTLRYRSAVAKIGVNVVELASGESISGDLAVLASGAWTPQLAEWCGIDLPGEPVKGQLVRFAAPDHVLNRFIHSDNAYLIPRRGLGVVVGSTMVLSGFDKSEDPRAIDELAEQARIVLPALGNAAIAETWTGLRPRLVGGLPVIAKARADLVVATGHFRNGILLAPITAAAIASFAFGRPPPCDLSAFALAKARS